MSLGVSEGDTRAIEALEPEVRITAEALGASLADRLVELAPSLTRDGDDTSPSARLVALSLDRERDPDPVSLVACLGAHRAYLARRGNPEGVSLGALALARLLVWATRASMIGPAPEVVWLGPGARRPAAGPDQYVIVARARAEVSSGQREAVAEALVRERRPD
ncbi:MAG: hypothetical protein OEM67_01425 [Thermoleophilia bacterium]|nr:hypothetical protein [Thermoleophilia bacterium]MDH3725348.1 hypothetical protein [Thermoleophilia bacterium]